LAPFSTIATALEPAHDPSPPDGATDVNVNVVVSWSPGDINEPVTFFVFLSESFEDVNKGNIDAWKSAQSETCYTTDPLCLGVTYYWRVDSFDDYNYAPGQIWSFTVEDCIVVDDMESYNDANGHIWDTWVDGCGDMNGVGGNGTGSCIFLETATIHTGTKSMCYYYDNCETDPGDRTCYSETTRTFDTPCNWSDNGEKALVLWFHGDNGNDGTEMWVVLNDGTTEAMSLYGVEGEDPNDIMEEEWIDWNIDLRDFSEAGLDLSSVVSITIGFGERYGFEPYGGKGGVYFDDIRLYPRRCVPRYGPAADLSGNCLVFFEDLQIMAGEWVHSGNVVADLCPDNKVDFKDYGVFVDSWLEQTPLWPAP
jgi:hypothetical protein